MILALFFLLLAGPACAEMSRTMPAQIVRIVDADTVDVLSSPYPGMTMADRVRILGLSAPETYQPECEQERDIGRVATAFVRSHIGDTVWLVDVQDERDAFGRVLARVVTEDGTDIGRALIAEGLATVWPEPEGFAGWCGEN